MLFESVLIFERNGDCGSARPLLNLKRHAGTFILWTSIQPMEGGVDMPDDANISSLSRAQRNS